MPRKAPPLSSFSPELKQAWVEAATRVVIVTLDTRSQATSLRHRLYKLRSALQAEADPLYESAKHGVIRILKREDEKFDLIMEPSDTIYKEAFAKAGVEVPEAPALPDVNFGD